MCKEKKIINKINEIFQKPYHINEKITDHLAGDMFEKLIGKDIDNNPLPDLNEINTEIKCKKDKTGRSTIFTKIPDHGMSHKEIYEKYGYISKDSRKRLQMSVYTNPNKRGFYLYCNEEKIIVMENNNYICSWNLETIEKTLKQKMPNLFLVEYYIDKIENNIEYHSLQSFKNINTNKIKECFKNDIIQIDFRMSEKENGKIKDYGIGFRTPNKKSKSINFYNHIYEQIEYKIKNKKII
jgi:hypothetical protein